MQAARTLALGEPRPSPISPVSVSPRGVLRCASVSPRVPDEGARANAEGSSSTASHLNIAHTHTHCTHRSTPVVHVRAQDLLRTSPPPPPPSNSLSLLSALCSLLSLLSSLSLLSLLSPESTTRDGGRPSAPAPPQLRLLARGAAREATAAAPPPRTAKRSARRRWRSVAVRVWRRVRCVRRVRRSASSAPTRRADPPRRPAALAGVGRRCE